MTSASIAALYVETGGTYYGLEGVGTWDAERDARQYAGPHPVIAHPPCKRWGRYWYGGPSCKKRKLLGDDGGCFAQAWYRGSNPAPIKNPPRESILIAQ